MPVADFGISEIAFKVTDEEVASLCVGNDEDFRNFRRTGCGDGVKRIHRHQPAAGCVGQRLREDNADSQARETARANADGNELQLLRDATVSAKKCRRLGNQ